MVDFGKAINRIFKNPRKSFKILLILSIITLPSTILDIIIRIYGQMLEHFESLIVTFPLYLLVMVIYIPVALITGWIVSGYIYRATKYVYKRKYELPELNDWTGMLKNGIRLWGVNLIYGFAIMIILAIVVMLGVVLYFVSKYVLIAYAIIGGFVGLIALFLFIYISPMITMSVIATDSISEGLRLRKIIKRSFNQKYFIAFLLCIAVGMISSFIMIIGILPLLLTIIGWIFWIGIVSVAAHIIQFTIYMETYKEVEKNGK